MAVLVIAGSGRGAGKTAVGCALIAALSELRWVAVKVTPHGHDGISGVWEEPDRDSVKDTGRYLAAGAERAFLVSEAPSASPASEWLLEVRRRAPDSGALLVESNRIELESIAGEGEPALCVMVLSEPEVSWKASVMERIARTKRLVLVGGLSPEELRPELQQRPMFRLPAGEWVTPELLEFVRARLLAKD